MFNFRKRKKLREEKKRLREEQRKRDYERWEKESIIIKELSDKVIKNYLPLKYESIKWKLDNDADFYDANYYDDCLQFSTDIMTYGWIDFEIKKNDITKENDITISGGGEYMGFELTWDGEKYNYELYHYAKGYICNHIVKMLESKYGIERKVTTTD